MQLYILANILPNLSRPYKFVFDILFVYMPTRARADNDYGYKSGFSGFCLLTK